MTNLLHHERAKQSPFAPSRHHIAINSGRRCTDKYRRVGLSTQHHSVFPLQLPALAHGTNPAVLIRVTHAGSAVPHATTNPHIYTGGSKHVAAQIVHPPVTRTDQRRGRRHGPRPGIARSTGIWSCGHMKKASTSIAVPQVQVPMFIPDVMDPLSVDRLEERKTGAAVSGGRASWCVSRYRVVRSA